MYCVFVRWVVCCGCIVCLCDGLYVVDVLCVCAMGCMLCDVLCVCAMCCMLCDVVCVCAMCCMLCDVVCVWDMCVFGNFVGLLCVWLVFFLT